MLVRWANHLSSFITLSKKEKKQFLLNTFFFLRLKENPFFNLFERHQIVKSVSFQIEVLNGYKELYSEVLEILIVYFISLRNMS